MPPPPAQRAAISVGFVSLGCAKNLVDSQVMAGQLLAAGIVLAPSPEAADVVIVNTCAFIGDAKRESIDAILAACKRREAGSCRAVVVAGCLPQRYRDELKASLPEVDAFIGLDQLENIPRVVRRVMKGERGLLDVADRSERLYEPRMPAVVFTGGPFAYLKIAEGCDHRCTFCAIPGIRGAYRSRPVRRIVAEAEALLAKGFRELNLISQDTTAYGADLGDGTDLPALLRALGRIGGAFWIRALYGYPPSVDARLLAAMAETPQVCRYLDLPIQHSHPDVLRRMGRARGADLAGILRRIRRALPDVTLRTTCLVGFPGETEAHFQHVADFVAEAGFDHLGVFAYSPEEGTPAERLPDRPPHRTARRRRTALLRVQAAVAAHKVRALLGQRAEALLERPDGARPGAWIARAARQAPEVDGVTRVAGLPGRHKPGDFVTVRYTGASGCDLLAAPA